MLKDRGVRKVENNALESPQLGVLSPEQSPEETSGERRRKH